MEQGAKRQVAFHNTRAPGTLLKRRVETVIAESEAGRTVIDFLVERFPYRDRDGWLGIISEGRILVDAIPVINPGDVLKTGQILSYVADNLPEPRVNLNVTFLHEDDDILVVNKPPNLPCHPGRRYFNNTLWAFLKTSHGVEEPTFINRLDRETSGITLVAKNADAARKCRRQFERRQVEKRYLVLVEGAFPETVDAAGLLIKDEASVLKTKRLFVQAAPGPVASSVAGQGAGWAETSFKLISRHGYISLVEATPRTGRQHQIRAVLHTLGFPVVGDKVYGVDPAFFLRFCNDTLSAEDRLRMRLNRQALHAAGLKFRHPRTCKDLSFEAPLPDDMAVLVVRKREQT